MFQTYGKSAIHLEVMCLCGKGVLASLLRIEPHSPTQFCGFSSQPVVASLDHFPIPHPSRHLRQLVTLLVTEPDAWSCGANPCFNNDKLEIWPQGPSTSVPPFTALRVGVGGGGDRHQKSQRQQSTNESCCAWGCVLFRTVQEENGMPGRSEEPGSWYWCRKHARLEINGKIFL